MLTCIFSVMSQVKVEEEDQQVFCIKEEPEEAPEVISCLLLDNQLNRGHLAQSEVTFLTLRRPPLNLSG